jgi:hypothetical protein
MVALDFPLLKRWWPAAWLRWLAGRRPGLLLPLGKLTIALAQWRESFTHRYERVKLARVAASQERDLTFSRQVQHE